MELNSRIDDVRNAVDEICFLDWRDECERAKTAALVSTSDDFREYDFDDEESEEDRDEKARADLNDFIDTLSDAETALADGIAFLKEARERLESLLNQI